MDKNKYTHFCYNTHHFNRNWNHGGHRNSDGNKGIQ